MISAVEHQIPSHYHEVAREKEILGGASERLTEINYGGLNTNTEIVNKCATYDVLCYEKMISVKANNYKENGQIQYGTYKEALRASIGAEAVRGPYSKTHDPANMRAAEQFMKLKASNPSKWQSLQNSLPPDVWRANTEKAMSKALGKHGYVAVSPDQLEKARENIAQDVIKNPQAWKGSRVPLRELPNRIIPFDPDISSGDLSKRIYHEE